MFWLASIVVFGISVQALGLISFLAFYFRRKPTLPNGNRPGLTIVKPCYKAEDGEEKHFDSYFHQDYDGPVEILFVVSHHDDPIVPLVKSYLDRYPKADARLIVSQTRKAYWRKIDAYYDGFQQAKHDFMVISDSDTIVGPEYVREMLAALSEPGVSAVTVPQYDAGTDNFATALKTLGNNCDVAVYVMIMNLLVQKKKVAWGHSFGFKRSEFNEFGEEGWNRIRTTFGDDLVLPTLYSEKGKKVVYRNIYCPVQYSSKTLEQMLDQQRRFALCQKAALGQATFIFGLLLFPQVTAAAFVLLSGFSILSIELFLGVWAVRTLVSLVFEGLMFKSIKNTLLWFWTIPLWDLMKVYFSACVFGQTQVRYHGKLYDLREKSRLVEVIKVGEEKSASDRIF